jgi:hypothetical protein
MGRVVMERRWNIKGVSRFRVDSAVQAFAIDRAAVENNQTWVYTEGDHESPDLRKSIVFRRIIMKPAIIFRPIMKGIYITLALIIACVFGGVGSLYGAGQYIRVEYPPSAAPDKLQLAVTYGLAKVPQTPAGKFGRPLFQSMTHHDTPAQPLPQMQYVDVSAKAGETHTYSVITVNSVGLGSEPSRPKELPPQTQSRRAAPRSDRYHFEGTISREVLESYLDRSVTMAYFLVTGKPEGNREYLYRDDDVRLIRNIGAKFIGRAIYRWNGEGRLNDPNFWTDAKALIDKVHAFDPDVIFQGCLFETISREVNRVKIPSWVFADFDLPVEDRTFSYEAMLNKDGKLVNHWGRSSVPDVTTRETQLWFYYLAGSYIDLGCEALHLGQVGLIGMADPDLKEWSRLVARIRAYAKTHARRKMVLLDAHVPTGGMIVDGVSLLDFNSFPMRIKAIPEKPYEAELQVNHLDAIYRRSKGCVSPSGWSCKACRTWSNSTISAAAERPMLQIQSRFLSGVGMRSPGFPSRTSSTGTNGSSMPTTGSRKPTPTGTWKCR